MNDYEKNKRFINNFCDFMSEPEPFDKKEIQTELEELGIDTKELTDKVKKIVIEGSKKWRLSWQKRAKEMHMRIKKIIESKTFDEKKQNIKNKLNEMLSGTYGKNSQSFAETYFRKKDFLTENDLKGLIRDIENLDLLDKLFEED